VYVLNVLKLLWQKVALVDSKLLI